MRYPEGKIHEDEFIIHELLYKAKKVVYTNEIFYVYTQRNESITGSGFKIQNKFDAIEALEKRILFFEKIGLTNLKNRTYKVLFGIYKTVNDYLLKVDSEECLKKEFKKRFSSHKRSLRKSKQSLKFKVFYELYCVSPSMANIIQNLNKKIRKRSNK